MPKPVLQLLALGGTIATRPGASGGMTHGLGADDLVAMAPALGGIATIRAETVARVGSYSITIDMVHALAARIRDAAAAGADGVVVTQGTDTLEETAFLLDVLLDVDIPVVVTAAMRNPSLASADGPGNLVAAARVATAPWARQREVGVLAVMLDHAHAAFDVAKTETSRIDAFRSATTGPVATIVEDRVVPLARPVRAWKDAVRATLGSRSPARFADAKSPPVALLWLGLGEAGGLLDAMARADDALGHGGLVLGAMGGGHVPDPLLDRLFTLAARLPLVVAPRAGGGPLLRRTYEGPGSEMALRAGGLMYAGRLHPLKARLLLDTLLRAGADRAAIAATLDACE